MQVSFHVTSNIYTRNVVDLTTSFWLRALRTLSSSSAHRFIVAFREYSESIVQQAHDREEEHIRDVESYLALRRETIGAKLAFALLDCEEGLLNDPRIVELENTAIDIISLCNVSGAITFNFD